MIKSEFVTPLISLGYCIAKNIPNLALSSVFNPNIELFSNNIKEQEYLLNKIEGLMQSSGMQTRRSNFRQEQIYLSCMPFMENNINLKKASGRNVLTSGLTATYPFISSAIFDEEGIFLGSNIYNNSLVFIDRYNKSKYKNANMCIFGTSGSRKIFFY